MPTPIHVSKLKAGDQVKISLKAGYGVEADSATGLMSSPKKGRRALGYTRTTFYGWLMSNDPSHGTMTVSLQDMVFPHTNIVATVLYKNILHLQQVVPQGRPVVETATKIHPGSQALGTKMSQLFPQPYLIPVTFVGE